MIRESVTAMEVMDSGEIRLVPGGKADFLSCTTDSVAP